MQLGSDPRPFSGALSGRPLAGSKSFRLNRAAWPDTLHPMEGVFITGVIIAVAALLGPSKEITTIAATADDSIARYGGEVSLLGRSETMRSLEFSARTTFLVPSEDDGLTRAMMVSANARYYISDSRIRPFAGFGVGLIAHGEQPDSGRDTGGIVLNPECGMDWQLTPTCHLTSFVRYSIATYSDEYVSWMGGIGIRIVSPTTASP